MKALTQPPDQGPTSQSTPARFVAPLPSLCHVTIVAPRRKADLAVPADIPLSHVLPDLLRTAGEAGGDSAAAPGWVLQRLGGHPLDIGQNLGALGVLDGEVLYLRPSESVLPPAMFDDVADVVATGVTEGNGRWADRHTRLMGVGGATAVLTAGSVTLTTMGPPWTVSVVLASVFAGLLIAVGTALSRAVGDSSAGALIGYAALPYGFFAGLMAPASAEGAFGFGAPNMLAAFASVALVATVGVVAIADGAPGFLGAAIASTAGALGAAVVMVFGAAPTGVATVTLTVLLAFSPLIPMLSFKLARLPMPVLPTSAEELRNDNEQIDGETIRERTVHAQRYATGLVAGMGMVALVTLLYLAMDDGWLTATTALTMSLTLVMRARVFQGLGQRLWLVIPGLAGVVALLVLQVAGAGGVAAIAAVMALLCVAGISAGVGLWLPSGRPSPFWGRAGDILEVLLIVALFPLALGILDVYSWVRGLAG
ncbi:type VII secretion integral membrane protein EccD [Streptosporangium sp. CA-115845]|uniref:type VII secretion integral membrane protein EccD n=1 Tax=Streptosporangium sp. CA-115845 TaxID=3240071 RepID=UPI003D8CD110